MPVGHVATPSFQHGTRVQDKEMHCGLLRKHIILLQPVLAVVAHVARVKTSLFCSYLLS